jgi:hypothetical protein
VGAGAAGALLAGAVGAGSGMLLVQDSFRAQAELSRTQEQIGAELVAKEELGNTLAVTANSLYIAAGVVAVVTGVAALFFTDWEGEGDEVEPATDAPVAAAR